MVPRGFTNARDKIIRAASDLFYKQGYQSTTIDQVIEQSGVSRPTVYSHFSTKEDLCLAYLKGRRAEDLERVKERVRAASSARKKFLAVIHYVRSSMLETHYRGCGYFNMISEIPDARHPIVKEARVYVDGFREIISEVTKELKASDPKYRKLDANYITDVYYLTICGAIMAGQEYRESWPLDQAVKAVENLIKV